MSDVLPSWIIFYYFPFCVCVCVCVRVVGCIGETGAVEQQGTMERGVDYIDRLLLWHKSNQSLIYLVKLCMRMFAYLQSFRDRLDLDISIFFFERIILYLILNPGDASPLEALP